MAIERLTEIFNVCVALNYWPAYFKVAKIVPKRRKNKISWSMRISHLSFRQGKYNCQCWHKDQIMFRIQLISAVNFILYQQQDVLAMRRKMNMSRISPDMTIRPVWNVWIFEFLSLRLKRSLILIQFYSTYDLQILYPSYLCSNEMFISKLRQYERRLVKWLGSSGRK